RFLGVWDTVAALGIPIEPLDAFISLFPRLRHEFHDLSLSDSVEHARHALAIDDERLLFHPTLWNREVAGHQTMKQVWFCGMHSDVGGGYREQELSDIPLTWMIQEATEQGLRIFPRHRVIPNPDPDGTMHDSSSVVFRKRVRSWDAERRGKPTVHQSVLMRKRDRNNNDSPPYDPWILRTEYDVEPWPGHTL
ncbi:MAG: phospholipase effector Tle1 domain-containing protein, partial [Dehalococcoidia bacterium]